MRQGQERDYIEVSQQRASSLNIKKLLQIKGNQLSQVKEFSTFLRMGKWKLLGSLQPSLWCISATCGHYPVFFFSFFFFFNFIYFFIF